MCSSKWESSFSLWFFILMNMEEDSQVPLLLGRPFLALGAALIDVQKGVLTLRVGESVHFNLNKSLEQLDTNNEDCITIDRIIPISSELTSDCNLQNSIKKNEMNF